MKKRQLNTDGSMSFEDHLRELRNRILICIVCILIFFFLGLGVAPKLIELLAEIGRGYGYSFVYIAPQELLLQHFSVAMIASVCLSLPMILYHIWGFIRPGLKTNENRLFAGALLAGLACFITGVLVAYKIMLPFILRFLIGLGESSSITASISIANYISFLMTIFIIMGIVFELPIICILLHSLGLIRVEWMIKARKYVIVLSFLISALITPPDVVSQCMVAIPMLCLYQLSIWICLLLSRKNKIDASKEDLR